MRFQFLSLLPLAFARTVPLEARQDNEELRVSDNAISYEGYKVFRVDTSSSSTSEVIEALADVNTAETLGAGKDFVDVTVSAEDEDAFSALGLSAEVTDTNLAASIVGERFSFQRWGGWLGRNRLPDLRWFSSYHPYADHITFWRDLNRAFRSNSEWFSTGTSLEGRDIFGLKLFGRRSVLDRIRGRNKPAIVWHATVHAREWITLSSIEYTAYQLINGYITRDPQIRRFLDNYDIYIVPVANPDGFIFSQTTDRLFRKNRRPAPAGVNATNTLCQGVDLNRNWPIEWDTNPQGSSPNPCTQVYRGVAPSSEPEIQGFTNHILGVASRQRLINYMDWHSFSQVILSPYGFTCERVPPNHQAHLDLMAGMTAAISGVYNTVWSSGAICPTLYAVNGGSIDWALEVAGAEFSLAFELRDRGQFRFTIPPEQILPAGVETWEGVKYMLDNLE